MSRRRFYAGLAVAFLASVVGVVYAPEPTLVILAASIPVAMAAAVVATLYCIHVYRAQPVPRSRFFGMVVETFVAMGVLGGWVGYLSLARTIERAELGWIIPAPGPTISGPISAALVVLVFLGPVRFALEIYTVRRRSTVPRTAAETLELDRREPEELTDRS